MPAHSGAMFRAAVFVDRDGVLVESGVDGGVPQPVATVDDLRILPGVMEACKRIRASGLKLICVTNQPDVSRGTVALADVEAVNSRLADVLALDGVLVCPHDDGDACTCRKPVPGMLHEAASRWSIDLSSSVMVGDRWNDVEAGRRAGCYTVFIDRGYAERRPDNPDAVAPDLVSAVSLILDRCATALPQRLPSVPDISQLKVRIFADGADRDGMIRLAADPLIRGFTTNPTLMRAAGVSDYERFARDVIGAVPKHPISFEVFADDFDEMERQALRIASWGKNVFVKIPVTDTTGSPTDRVVSRLVGEDVKLNVTALLTLDQVRRVKGCLAGGPECFVSVFAGRIADTGRDPVPLMREAMEIIADAPNISLIWASPREVLNVVQADAIGCHVITVTHDLLRKLTTLGKELTQFSLETVQMFHRDAQAAGFTL
jgi:transaldolase